MENLNAEDFVQQLIKTNTKFWQTTRGKISINFYQLLIYLISNLNITKVRILNNTYLACKQDNVIELIESEDIAQRFIQHIEDVFPDEKSLINKIGILDAVVEKSEKYYNKHVINHLPVIDVTIKNDTKTNCYIAFENGVLDISRDATKLISLKDFKNHILENRIIRRKFERSCRKLKGDFVKFVWNLAGHSPYRFKVLCSTIGYLIHNYKDPVTPKMVILIDQVIGELETNNGGSGKSLLLKSIGYIRNLVELSGKRLQTTNRFALQRVDAFTDVILVNDARKNENLDNWYNISSDGTTIERKYQKEQILSAEDSPKIAFTSNHMIVRSEGNSSERRVHETEISDWYNKDNTPQDEFGRNLFDDFNSDDWKDFDNFMVYCVEYYLQFGLLTPPKINILKRKLLSEVGVELVEFIDEKLAEGITKFHKKDTYDEFVKGGYINRKYIPLRNSFTRKLKKYFEYKGLAYNETPSDSKNYIELITEEKLQEITSKSIKDVDTDYRLIDTDGKLNQLNKQLKQHLL